MTLRAPTPRFSVAPMMAWTDRPYRRMMRRITRHALLYTEMVTTGAVLHGDADRHLARAEETSPLALQVGGDDPDALAEVARRALAYGYDEVNLNVGCPSDRVQRGRFGACLMAHPDVVARAVEAMRAAVPLPVTVKHRIGIDDADAYDDLRRFVDVVADAGADRFTVHARKAWLQGLSPKENRTVPPLRHDAVARLAAERPDLVIETNGGIQDLDGALAHLEDVASVMVGRAAYQMPMRWVDVDRRVFGATAPAPTLRTVIDGMRDVVEDELVRGTRFATVVKPMIALARGVPGARGWRRTLSEGAHRPGAGPDLLDRALATLPDAVLDGVSDVAATGGEEGGGVGATDVGQEGGVVASAAAVSAASSSSGSTRSG
mgnify:CR=1 FL=1